MLIHFPIALFLTGVAFDLVGTGCQRPMWRMLPIINFLIAALATFPVMTTGLVAWQWQLEGHKLKGILLLHLVLGVVSSS